MRYIAFLRGINLGKRRLPMSRLSAFFEELGLSDVETFIASGNVLFSSKAPAAQLESQIAKHLETSLGYGVDPFVRTAEEVARIGNARIFPETGREDTGIYVGFFQQKLAPEIARRFAAVRTAEDEFRVVDREFYWLCRVRSSDSKVWKLPELKALRLPTSTLRNMSTIRKLIAQRL